MAETEVELQLVPVISIITANPVCAGAKPAMCPVSGRQQRMKSVTSCLRADTIYALTTRFSPVSGPRNGTHVVFRKYLPNE